MTKGTTKRRRRVRANTHNLTLDDRIVANLVKINDISTHNAWLLHKKNQLFRDLSLISVS